MRSILSLLVVSLVQVNAASLTKVIGATHWSPCYYISDLPSLIDGASTLALMGTQVIKISLDEGYSTYPFHSDWSNNWTSLQDQLSHPYFNTVFSNSVTPLNYLTYILVINSRPCPEGNCGDVCSNFTAQSILDWRTNFADMSTYLLETFAGSGKRFIFQQWEGDWMTRCGAYDAKQPAAKYVLENMRLWHQARQNGVNDARSKFCLSRYDEAFCSNSTNHKLVMEAANVEVYNALEVNLVKDSLETGFPNLINQVVPFLELDLVSYSSYDSMATSPGFGQALDYIMAQHNRTSASPGSGFYIGEYGVAQEVNPLSTLINVTENVLAYALDRKAEHIMFWELFNNEVDSSFSKNERCSASTGPDFNLTNQNGFWLIRPDGTQSWAWGYLQGVINGTIPIPLPPV